MVDRRLGKLGLRRFGRLALEFFRRSLILTDGGSEIPNMSGPALIRCFSMFENGGFAMQTVDVSFNAQVLRFLLVSDV